MRAACVIVVSSGLLGLAGALTPDPSGVGTHQQLGFPPCGLMLTTGIPCPTCGMTTAFAYAARGRFGRAMITQPFGALLAVAAWATVAVSLGFAISGRSWRVNWYRVSPGWVAVTIVVLFGAAWGYKILAVRVAGWT